MPGVQLLEISLPRDLPHREGVLHALAVAGENRQQLLGAISHFLQKGDHKKLAAVCHLVSESALRFYASYKEGYEAAEGDKPTFIPDAMLLKSSFLIDHVEWNFGIRGQDNQGNYFLPGKKSGKYPQFSWAADVSEETFYSSVLPYRGQTERPPDELFAKYLFDPQKFETLKLGISFEEFHKSLGSFSSRYAKARSVEKKAEILEELIYFINTDILVKRAGRTYAPRGPEDMSILDVFRNKSGRCTDLCHGSMYILRALGLPATHDRIPLWGKGDDNHTWVRTQMPYKAFIFDGGCDAASMRSEANYYSRMGYGQDDLHHFACIVGENTQGPYSQLMRNDLQQRGMAYMQDNYSFVEDYYLLGTNANPIPKDYYGPHTVEIEGLQPGKRYHLAVFNRGNFEAILPAVSDFQGRVSFPGVQAKSILYSLAIVENGKTIPVGTPFSLEEHGVKNVFSGGGRLEEVDFLRSNKDVRQLEPNTAYGLFYFGENGRQVLQQKLTTDGNGNLALPLSTDTLYLLHTLKSPDASGKISLRGLHSPSEQYVLWQLVDGEWVRAQQKKADENGNVSFAGLDKKGTYAVSHWYYSEEPRPFFLNDESRLESK